MAKVSAEAENIRQTLTRDSLASSSISDKRNAWEAAARSAELPDGVSVSDRFFAGVPCAVHIPIEVAAPRNLIVYLHGGGLVEGSAATAREWCSRLARATRCSVVAIDYSLAPENPYPAAIDEVTSVCTAISDDGAYSLLSVGGDSTGCILAVAAVLDLRDSGKHMPSSCFLLSPSVDLGFTGDSIDANSTKDLVVSPDVLCHYAELYAGAHSLVSPAISPLFADLRNFPPTLIHVDASELLLDDAIRLESNILEAGGDTRLVVSEGLWHAWPTWGDFPEARIAIQDIVDHICP